MKAHPAAEIFPLMVGAEFDALAADIKQHGQRDPIVLLDGAILDGRNRYRACETLGIPPVTTNWHGDGSAEAFVISHNLHRRHLNESQRAMIGARLATRPNGGDRTRVDISTLPVSGAQAAEMLNVNRSSLFAAKKVLAEGTPEEIKAADSGAVAVNTVAKQIRAGVPAEERPQHRAQVKAIGKTKRARSANVNSQVWSLVRDALVNLTSLPDPVDVARIARGQDKAGLVDKRLEAASNYLKEFSDAWNNRDEA